MSVRRKFANLLEYFNPFSTIPAPQDEDTPAAKKPRLHTSTCRSVAADIDTDAFIDAHATETATTASPDETVAVGPTDTVTETAAATSSRASRAYYARRKWYLEEDAKLTEAITIHGKDWAAVAALVPGRTNNCCRLRWVKYLDPGINKAKWTVEEDATLIDAVKERGKDWVRVAALVPGRTNMQCHQRWVDSFNPDTNTCKYTVWTVEEDEKLTEAVTEFGNDWAQVRVGAMVPGRTNIQCRHRWVSSLDPNNNNNNNNKHTTGKWKAEEDAKLAEAVTEFGNDSIRVATLVSGRTNVQCYQRWAPSLDPSNNNNNNNNNTGKWTVEENSKLTEAFTEFGNDWIRVATLVPGRTNVQCRRRWCWVNTLDTNNNSNTNNNTGKWTVEEDAKLTEAVAEFGNDWIRVATLVPGRTNVQCRKRWVNRWDPNNHNNTKKWTVEEDAKLAEAVTEFGNDWIRVAALVPGRTNVQCHRRGTKYLSPEH
jgi:hypothetical protein